MNYEKNYYDYIAYVKTLNRSKDDGNYYERHHIVPRSLGGSNDDDNLVLLTAREHFLAHYLLWKFRPCSQTAHAFWCMCQWENGNRKITSSRLFEEARKAFNVYNRLPRGPQSEEQVKHRVELNTGKKRTEETKKKMSAKRTAYYQNETEEARALRIEKTRQATKEAMNRPEVRAKVQAGRNSPEVKARMKEKLAAYWADPENHKKHSERCTGRTHSEETKKKISELQKNRTPEEWAEIKRKQQETLLKNEAFQEKIKQNAEKKRIAKEEAAKKKEERHQLALQHYAEAEAQRIEQTKDSKLKWFNNGIENTRAEFPPDETWVRGKLKKHLQ